LFCQAQQVVETLKEQFKYPIGVTVDLQGNIYVADTQNNEIKLWNAGSKKLETIKKQMHSIHSKW
jgi:sugar lactone lactonase YvrE